MVVLLSGGSNFYDIQIKYAEIFKYTKVSTILLKLEYILKYHRNLSVI